MMKIKILTSETCGPCKTLKAGLKREDFEFEEIDIKTEEGLKLVEENLIRTVPALFVDEVFHYMDSTEMVNFLKKRLNKTDATQDVNKLLADVTVFSKYAKYDRANKRRETWFELVGRNMDMHIRQYPRLEKEIRKAYKFVFAKKVLPSMRSLQFGGSPIEMANNRIYNCAYMPVKHKVT